jgi:hypothetical protein
VDVLAAIEGAARELWVQGQPVNPHAADLISARAAVAELIASARLARNALDAHGIHGGALNAINDALARVGGAP